MGIVFIRIKIMPTSPDVDLEALKIETTKAIENNQGKNTRYAEEPIAFGLKALIATFSLDESAELEPIEKALANIEEVSSAQVIDMRRGL